MVCRSCCYSSAVAGGLPFLLLLFCRSCWFSCCYSSAAAGGLPFLLLLFCRCLESAVPAATLLPLLGVYRSCCYSSAVPAAGGLPFLLLLFCRSCWFFSAAAGGLPFLLLLFCRCWGSAVPAGSYCYFSVGLLFLLVSAATLLPFLLLGVCRSCWFFSAAAGGVCRSCCYSSAAAGGLPFLLLLFCRYWWSAVPAGSCCYSSVGLPFLLLLFCCC